MISFRHHVVSLVAVFLALAVGVVLGAGPLSGVDAAVTDESSGTQQEGSAQAAAAYSDGFVDASAPRLVSGALSDQRVSIVSMPGADDEAVTALQQLVTEAGGTTTGRYALTETMLDPGEKALVDTLGSQLAEQQQDGLVEAGASTYDRIGQLLGRAIATDGDRPAASGSVLEGMQGAGLLTLPEDTSTRAPLVLVVLGDAPEADGAGAIVAGLAEGIAATATGVVVAGTVADGDGGQLGELRSEPVASEVTTVDGVDTAAGRAATVLSLGVSDKPGGAFGASGEDGPAPLG